MSHFHHYSLNNTMLIYLQKPDATLVAGYDKWKNQFERHVNRGEKGIKIIAPVPYTVKQTREKRDPQTRAVLLDASGQAQTEEVEVRLTHYRVVPVFDVSQTDGKPLPTIVNDLQGNVEHFDAFMEAVFRTSPVPIEITSIDNGADGFFSPSQQQINIREGMSEVQTVSAVIHEMAHAKLHDYNRRQQEATDIVDAKPKDRHTEEVEAESVSYAVCQYYGIETGENSFGYIAEWSKGRDLPELRSSLETINRTASELITDIDRHLKEIMHERGLDQEQEAPAAAQGTPTLETVGVQPAYALMPDPPVVRFYHPEHDGNELPVGPSTAQKLFDQGVPVYSYDRSTEGDRLVRDRKLLEGTPALYAVQREDWLQSPHHAEMLADLRSVQQTMEAALQNSPVDAFLIYQMRDDAGDGGLRFSNLADMRLQQVEPVSSLYEPIYLAPLPPFIQKPDMATLNDLYHQFNMERPADFHGHSLSVSDVVALRVGGETRCYFVDSFGFKPLDHFIQPENYLRNADMAMEDDAGMIDGIINNGRNPALEPAQPAQTQPQASAEDRRERALPSLRDQLQQARHQAHNQPHHTTPHVRKEQER